MNTTCAKLAGAATLTSLAFLMSVAPAKAQYPMPGGGGYFSSRLGAEFHIGPIFLPGYGTFYAARLVSHPMPGSPLHEAGLGLYDVITRLDGIQVDRYAELDNHYDWTTVRFIKHRTTWVQDGQIFIPYAGGVMPAPSMPAPVPLPAPPAPSMPASDFISPG